jgi:hypothetical protein
VLVIPGVVSHTYGRGRVVYLAGGFDSAYYIYAYPYQWVLVRNAINWAVLGLAPITVEAPVCVHSTFMRLTKLERRG